MAHFEYVDDTHNKSSQVTSVELLAHSRDQESTDLVNSIDDPRIEPLTCSQDQASQLPHQSTEIQEENTCRICKIPLLRTSRFMCCSPQHTNHYIVMQEQTIRDLIHMNRWLSQNCEFKLQYAAEQVEAMTRQCKIFADELKHAEDRNKGLERMLAAAIQAVVAQSNKNSTNHENSTRGHLTGKRKDRDD